MRKSIFILSLMLCGMASAQSTYTCTATGTVGNGAFTVSCSPVAVVTPPPVQLPVISSFTATPSAVSPGTASVLAWTVTGETSLSLTGVSGTPVSGLTVAPADTTVYTLTATNSAGSVNQSVTVTVNAGSAPSGTALTACGDITKAGSYYLANDVSSTEGCFGIDATGITLNLNGYTITYDTGGAINSPAIEGHDCWSTTNPAITGPCGSAHGGLEVYGGNIVQAASASTFSPAFEFGQGTFSSAPYIHNITATFQNAGSQFYFSNYIPTGAKIENNTIYDNVTSINKPGQSDLSARSAFQGQAIYIGQNNENPGVGDTVSGNTIVGSPQGGVRTVNQHSTISGNDISMNATYSNDFCADVPGDYTTVSNNKCHPKSGRGFHVNSNNVTVSNNTISVTELKQNAEYGGCEIGGTYGVQVEFDSSFLKSPPVGVQITGNAITAVSTACPAAGFRVTSMTPAGSASFTGNTVTTTSTGTSTDAGISLDATNNAGVIFSGNTFSSQHSYVYGDWDGYIGTIGANTWAGTPQFTVAAADGGCDPSQTDSGAVCPSSIAFTDSLPNTVSCGSFSEATVTIAGQTTQCKAKQ